MRDRVNHLQREKDGKTVFRIRVKIEDERGEGMTKVRARNILDELNGILVKMPLAMAVENVTFTALQRELHASEWRTVIDQFERQDSELFAKARLVAKESKDYQAVCG